MAFRARTFGPFGAGGSRFRCGGLLLKEWVCFRPEPGKRKSSVRDGGQSFPCFQFEVFETGGQGKSEGGTVREYCAEAGSQELGAGSR
jgi:hypothetical protein